MILAQRIEDIEKRLSALEVAFEARLGEARSGPPGEVLEIGGIDEQPFFVIGCRQREEDYCSAWYAGRGQGEGGWVVDAEASEVFYSYKRALVVARALQAPTGDYRRPQVLDGASGWPVDARGKPCLRKTPDLLCPPKKRRARR